MDENLQFDTMLAFNRLKITPTKDVQKIKKAYASLLSQCDPEKDPHAWNQLHNYYVTAMNYAQQIRPQAEQSVPFTCGEESGQRESSGYETLFQDLEGLAEQAEQEEQTIREQNRLRLEAERKRQTEELGNTIAGLKKTAKWRKLREKELLALFTSPAYRAFRKGNGDAVSLLEPLLALKNNRFDRGALRLLIQEVSGTDADGKKGLPSETVMNTLSGPKPKKKAAANPGGGVGAIIAIACFGGMLTTDRDLFFALMVIVATFYTLVMGFLVLKSTVDKIKNPRKEVKGFYLWWLLFFSAILLDYLLVQAM